jgi:hypothetical protein
MLYARGVSLRSRIQAINGGMDSFADRLPFVLEAAICALSLALIVVLVGAVNDLHMHASDVAEAFVVCLIGGVALAAQQRRRRARR